MSNLRNRVIKLAYEKKELRPVLLPLLKEAQFKELNFPIGWMGLGGAINVKGSPFEGNPYTHEPGTYIAANLSGGPSFYAKYVGRGQFSITNGGSSKAQAALNKVGPEIAKAYKLR